MTFSNQNDNEIKQETKLSLEWMIVLHHADYLAMVVLLKSISSCFRDIGL